MKILQIAPCFVDIYNETGGVANIIRQICLHLDKKKIKTVLICPNTELGKKVAVPGVIVFSEYLTVIVIDQYSNPLLGPIYKIKKILNSINSISIAHVHTCFSAITDYSMKFFAKKNIRYIFTPHGKLSPTILSNNQITKSIYFNQITKKSLLKSSAIITSSSNEIEYVKALGIDSQFSYIFNGYDAVSNFAMNENQLKLSSKKYLLFLGYLDPRKQPDLLIKAFCKSKALNTYKLVLAGPDSYGYKQKLLQLINELKLVEGDHVVFTGRIEGESKWNMIKNSKALLLPSKGEGWPVVIAEAIGTNVPLIISKECNFSEINNMQLGIEVKDFETNSWSVAIDEMCFNTDRYNNFLIGLKKYSEEFSWESITTQWINKYKEISNETGIK